MTARRPTRGFSSVEPSRRLYMLMRLRARRDHRHQGREGTTGIEDTLSWPRSGDADDTASLSLDGASWPQPSTIDSEASLRRARLEGFPRLGAF